MYELKVTMTEEDLSDYNIFHAENSKSMLKTSFFLRIMFPVVTIPMTILVFKNVSIFSWLLLVVISVLFYLKTPTLMRWSTKRRIKLMLREGKNGDMFLEKTINIDNLGIKLDSINTSVYYKWASIFRFIESENALYIYVNSIKAIAIPKKFVGNKEEINELSRFINLNIEK